MIIVIWIGWQGWCNGESTHLPPVLLRFLSPAYCYKLIDSGVGSYPCSKGFSLGFPVTIPP